MISSTTVEADLIVVGSDHGGYQMKESLKKYLGELGYRVLDVGTNSEEACDYPDYAYAVARIVAKGEAWRGIMIDATGVASSIVCNKVPGIRAAACFNEFVARAAGSTMMPMFLPSARKFWELNSSNQSSKCGWKHGLAAGGIRNASIRYRMWKRNSNRLVLGEKM